MRTRFVVLLIAAISFWRVGLAAAAEPATQPMNFDLKVFEKDRVLKNADAFLKEEPVTVTASHSPRSAGGAHDFFSEGDYWWPDPNNPDGPYIQKDGQTNPDNFVEHRFAMIRMSSGVAACTCAYKITGEQKYADHAIKHLKAWFVDDATKMNPNLLYGQAIKGIATGRGIGVIDTVQMMEAARSAQVLEKVGILKGDDLTGIKKWFADYLTWLTTHKYGTDEMNAANNHGTNWIEQVAAFAAFTGDQEKMELCRRRYKEMFLPSQMADDGSFPMELRRTKPYNYSLFNLDAMVMICQVLSTPQDNLFEFTTPDGKNIRKGIEFLFPYIKDKDKWPYKHDVMHWESWPVRSPALVFGALAYGKPEWVEVWKTLPTDPTDVEVRRNVPVRYPLLWVD